MTKDYYFISDLHIGGDGPLNQCDFEDELLSFLRELEQTTADAELIINGDAFGLWEFTKVKGIEKMKILIESHPELFEQFRKTSKNVPITLIPGNHDYDLACIPEYIPYLKQYGINLEPKVAITREIAGKKIWIEHGQQHDNFNKIEHFGDPADTPIGYFVTVQFVGGASELSKHGKQDWLKDIQAVYPTEHIPHWVFSNYFYKEMSPILRFMLAPFLLLFSLSVIAVALGFAEHFKILPPQLSVQNLLDKIGGFGILLGYVISINSAIISFLLLLAIPLFFVYRDIKSTLTRYHLIGHEKLAIEKEEDYIEAAKSVFKKNKDVKIFIYGHTHNVSLKHFNENVIINTGTWIKKLTRIPTRSRLMPDVYYPSYCLNYFKIFEENGKISVTYQTISKSIKSDLTLMQKLLTLGKKPKEGSNIPQKTII